MFANTAAGPYSIRKLMDGVDARYSSGGAAAGQSEGAAALQAKASDSTLQEALGSGDAAAARAGYGTEAVSVASSTSSDEMPVITHDQAAAMDQQATASVENSAEQLATAPVAASTEPLAVNHANGRTNALSTEAAHQSFSSESRVAAAVGSVTDPPPANRNNSAGSATAPAAGPPPASPIGDGGGAGAAALAAALLQRLSALHAGGLPRAAHHNAAVQQSALLTAHPELQGLRVPGRLQAAAAALHAQYSQDTFKISRRGADAALQALRSAAQGSCPPATRGTSRPPPSPTASSSAGHARCPNASATNPQTRSLRSDEGRLLSSAPQAVAVSLSESVAALGPAASLAACGANVQLLLEHEQLQRREVSRLLHTYQQSPPLPPRPPQHPPPQSPQQRPQVAPTVPGISVAIEALSPSTPRATGSRTLLNGSPGVSGFRASSPRSAGRVGLAELANDLLSLDGSPRLDGSGVSRIVREEPSAGASRTASSSSSLSEGLSSRLAAHSQNIAELLACKQDMEDRAKHGAGAAEMAGSAPAGLPLPLSLGGPAGSGDDAVTMRRQLDMSEAKVAYQQRLLQAYDGELTSQAAAAASSQVALREVRFNRCYTLSYLAVMPTVLASSIKYLEKIRPTQLVDPWPNKACVG